MITLTDEMAKAMYLIENTNLPLYITGKAGTGKTTLLRHIVANIKKKFVITASTGIAAINAGGVTLHSLLGIPFEIQDPNGKLKGGLSAAKVQLINTIDALVIDEISMVRPDTIDYIDKKLRIFRNCDQPFGGVQLIMFGDLFQLPPVVKSDEENILRRFYPGVYFFYANVFKNYGFQVIELNHIFRQSDPRFIEILNNIRSYQLSNDDIEDLAELRDKKQSNIFDSQAVHICSYKRDVNMINTKMLGEYTHTFMAEIKDNFNTNCAPCDIVLNLRVGARVMMLINDRQQGFCNGSLGVIEAIEDDIIRVLLDDGYSVTVGKYEWSANEYKVQEGKIVNTVLGTCRQFPITLAWAITIHKSQGLTFDNIVIHANNVFAPGQIYVALSRCTSLEGIVADTFISSKHILPDKNLLAFERAYKANNYIFNRETAKLMRQ